MAKTQSIFLVDDEERVIRVASETLRRLGLEVTCFASAADCLERLAGESCDLLIADLKMPGMDGLELLKRARVLAPWAPVLIITGYGDIPTAVKCIKAGAVDLVEKPLKKKSFVDKVKSILKENGHHSEALGAGLTRAEKRVVRLIIEGRSSKSIARLLNRSQRTIEVHRARAMHKLGAENVIDLIKRASEAGFVEL